MRQSCTLLLDGQLSPKGTNCLPLAFGFVEENALGTGRFKAIGVAWPLHPDGGRRYPDDFLQITFIQLPNGKIAATAQPSLRWVLNRHSNARPMHPVFLLDADVEYDLDSDADSVPDSQSTEISTLVVTDSDAFSVPDSQPDSVPASVILTVRICTYVRTYKSTYDLPYVHVYSQLYLQIRAIYLHYTAQIVLYTYTRYQIRT